MRKILGHFERAVLLSILSLGERAYGRAVLNESQSRLQREVTAGAVHATLDRLEQKDLISSQLGSGAPVRRPRRYYAVEDKGMRAPIDARSALQSLWRGQSA